MPSPNATPDASQPPLANAAALSVNALCERLVARLVDDAARFGVTISHTGNGTVLVDAGVAAPGSVAAGVLGSQYAGWSLSATKEQTGGKKFFSLGSGPARALAVKEPLFAELGYRDRHERGVLVLEVDRLPPQVVIDKVLHDCGLAPERLTLVTTPTHSVAGTVQVVARVVEVALHKTHVLGVPLDEVVEGGGSAPLPPPAPDGIQAMGRTNDAILYGGRVHLTVKHDAVAKQLAAELPASTSRDYGRPFADIFTSFNYDFYQIDPALFAPAEVWVSSLESGATYHGGRVDAALLHDQWGGKP